MRLKPRAQDDAARRSAKRARLAPDKPAIRELVERMRGRGPQSVREIAGPLGLEVDRARVRLVVAMDGGLVRRVAEDVYEAIEPKEGAA